MLRKKEISVILLLIVCLWSIACAETEMRTVTTRDPKTGKTISKQVPVAPKQADPHENTSVLVEAFVVRVSTEALAEAGANPIGQSPEGVSILKILSCLDDAEKGEVVSGSKIACINGNEAVSEYNNRIIVKIPSQTITNQNHATTTVSHEFRDYHSGRRFSVASTILSSDHIKIGFHYEQTDFEVNDEDESVPPSIFEYSWHGTASTKSGTPLIAGAAQDDDTVTFLILTATIQDAE